MRGKYSYPRLLATLMLTLILLAFGLPQRQVMPALAQGPDGGITVGKDYKHDVSPPIRNITPLPVPPSPKHENTPVRRVGQHQDQSDPVVQNVSFPAAMPGTILNFDGIPFPGVSCNCAPPDTNGEVGSTQ